MSYQRWFYVMNKPNFTPGPWCGKNIHIHSMFLEKLKISFGWSSRTDSEIEANSNLIAAAPDLYAALEKALPLLHTGDELPLEYYADKPGALGDAIRALRKARGEL